MELESNSRISELIQTLSLEKHIEGGYFKRVYRSLREV